MKDITALSISGIKYGALLPVFNIDRLATKLYHYYTFPTPLGQLGTTWGHAGLLADRGFKQTLDILKQYWEPVVAGTAEKTYWLNWRHRNNDTTLIHPYSCMYKLYVSPQVADFWKVLSEVIRVVSRHPVYSFKMGSNWHGISRPDKIIFYFSCYTHLYDAAKEIREVTKVFSPHGVPFTAQLFENAMLSWGIDPPVSSTKTARLSWRLWVTREIARGLVEGKRKLIEDPLQYTLDFVKSRGIDIECITPSDFFFNHNNKSNEHIR